MLTLCSEICVSKNQSVAVQDSSSPSKPGDETGAKGSKGSKSSKDRTDEAKRLKNDPASSSAAPADGSAGAEDAKKPGAPGPFGVCRQETNASVLQNALKTEVFTRNEELIRVQREDEQRAALVTALEREVYEKERCLVELKTGMDNLGISAASSAPAMSVENLAAIERERLQNEILIREGEASDLRQRCGALEELIREKRAEVVMKGEATLQLLFQLSCTATQQRCGVNPLAQSAPTVVNDVKMAPAAA